MHDFVSLTRKKLLTLPNRIWNKISEYDSLLLVPTGKKHDSGYSLLAIVGVNQRIPVEISAYCDDISWVLPTEHPYYTNNRSYRPSIMHTDCLFPSGIIHIWAASEHYFDGRFRVHESLSSTRIELYVHKHGVTQELLNAARKMSILEELL